MPNNLQNDYTFMTSAEISKALALRLKTIRKKRFKTQTLFAEHIGMNVNTYARFEQSGQISFVGLISVAKGLDKTQEIANLFNENSNLIQW